MNPLPPNTSPAAAWHAGESSDVAGRHHCRRDCRNCHFANGQTRCGRRLSSEFLGARVSITHPDRVSESPVLPTEFHLAR
jgi:hypothetical protein